MTGARSIQPVGFHVGLSSEWLVTAVSANIGDFLPCSAPDILGQPITALFSEDAIHDMRNRMALLRGDGTEHLFQYPLAKKGKKFDLAIYRAGDGFGLDAEPCDEHGFGDATGIVLGMLAQVDVSGRCRSFMRTGRQAAPRPDGLRARDDLRPRQVARPVGAKRGRRGRSSRDDPIGRCCHRSIVEAIPVPILADSFSGPSSTLRAPTKAETDVLEALDARAALVLPLTRDGEPWGHVGCYHRSARHVSAERRNIARLFSRIIALKIELAELRGRA